MAYDGTIRIDTEVDSKGISEGLSKGADVAKAALGGITVAIAAASAAAVALGKAVISSYADYEQLIGGVETLFGAGGKSLEEYAVSVGKTVADATGEYNTLVQSQISLMNYADEAYKTAGLSANEYMETATGFAASLVSSLGGDTKAAVEYANTAITDMADNANKMGSNIGSIQDAYQGFAKQNYTMLDNLKLGYGGTKTEMERLLADAEALSGVHFDISSYSDIVEAIHVIQDEMGITGTTAFEAEETISGSIGMLQSSFQNLITGLGNPSADVEKLCADMVRSFQLVVTNITPVVQNLIAVLPTVVTALVEAFGQMIPDVLALLTNLVSQILETILTIAPTVIPAITDTILSLVQTIIENLPLVIDTAVQLVLALVTGIAEALPELLPAAAQAVLTIVQGLIDNIPLLVEAALSLLQGFVEGLKSYYDLILEQGPELIQSLVDGLLESIELLVEVGLPIVMGLIEYIVEHLPEFIKMAVDIMNTVVTGLTDAIPLLVTAALDIVMALVEYILSNPTEFIAMSLEIVLTIAEGLIKAIPEIIGAAMEIAETIVNYFIDYDWLQLGTNIIDGLVNGIQNGMGRVWDAATSLAKSAWDSVTSFLDINSPSKKFYWIAEMMGDGMVGGLDDKTKDVVNSSHNMAQEALSAANAVNTTQAQGYAASYITNNTKGSNDTSVVFEEGAIVVQTTAGVTVDGAKAVARELGEEVSRQRRLKGGI